MLAFLKSVCPPKKTGGRESRYIPYHCQSAEMYAETVRTLLDSASARYNYVENTMRPGTKGRIVFIWVVVADYESDQRSD